MDRNFATCCKHIWFLNAKYVAKIIIDIVSVIAQIEYAPY
jgi:hypothetical protein